MVPKRAPSARAPSANNIPAAAPRIIGRNVFMSNLQHGIFYKRPEAGRFQRQVLASAGDDGANPDSARACPASAGAQPNASVVLLSVRPGDACDVRRGLVGVHARVVMKNVRAHAV